MTRDALNAAIEEAERFLLLATYLRKRSTETKLDLSYYPKECAAVKRASMDLTRIPYLLA